MIGADTSRCIVDQFGYKDIAEKLNGNGIHRLENAQSF